METIQEAYVSFETAKLLKEKGFPQDPYICNTAYTTKGKLSNNAKSFAHNIALYNASGIKPRTYSMAPSHQMAMRWLREAHKIAISTNCWFRETGCVKWHCTIVIYDDNLKKLQDIVIPHVNTLPYVDSYEEATEDAIKYCLEHLI